MDKLGKSLDQLITETGKQERQQRNQQQQQQRQRHQQNQFEKKQNALDQRRNISRQFNNNATNTGRGLSADHQIHHNQQNNSQVREMKVVTIQRPRIVNAPQVVSNHSSVFGRLGGDNKTVVVFDNLRSSVSEHDVRELCQALGAISDAFSHSHPHGLKTVRVAFDRAEDARKCVAEYNGVTLDGLPMRVSISGGDKAPATVFSRIQQPTGSSFNAQSALPALNTLAQQTNTHNSKVGTFGTALPQQQQQKEQHRSNDQQQQNARRVEISGGNNNNQQFKKERKDVQRVVKGRQQQSSQGRRNAGPRHVEVTNDHLDDQLDNYFSTR